MGHYDRIVIGSGIIGSFTAYFLSKLGFRTLLVEQHKLVQNHGCSQGRSRIIRSVYEEPFYADLMGESFSIWKEVEKKANERLYIQTGILEYDEKPFNIHENYVKNLERLNLPYKILSSDELNSKFPQLSFDSDTTAMFDPSGGLILADKALSNVQTLCEQMGTEIIPECQVRSIEPGDSVKIDTNKGKFESESVIVCAGSGSKTLLSDIGWNLPLWPEKCWVYYWREKVPGSMTAPNFPCFRANKDKIFYSVPSYEYLGYAKVGCHNGVICKDGDMDKVKNYPYFQMLQNFIERHCPALDPNDYFLQTCHYVTSPDEICILDKHPKYSNIIFCSGFSGTGFKKAPVIGKILNQLSNHETPSYDIQPFSAKRFSNIDF